MKDINKCKDLLDKHKDLYNDIMTGNYNKQYGDKLNYIFNNQMHWIEEKGLVNKEGLIIRKSDGKELNKVETTIAYINALSNELNELMDILPWKTWKQYKDYVIDEIELKFELIDILHFFMDLCILWNLTPTEIYAFYMVKRQENIDRQNRGY